MKNNPPKLIKYIRLYYDYRVRTKPLSLAQVKSKYNISHPRLYNKLAQLEKQYPNLKEILSHFKLSDLNNNITLMSIVKRLGARK